MKEPWYYRLGDLVFGPLYPLTVVTVAVGYYALVYWLTN